MFFRHRALGVLSVFVLTVTLAIAGPSMAPAVAQTNSTVIAEVSGLCLDVAGASPTPGAAVIQYTCSGNANQQWSAVDVGGGYIELQVRHSGQCLSVDGDGLAAPIVQWPCDGAASQQWSRNGVSLVARHSGQCLDVPRSSQENGVALTQYQCHGFTNQSFSLGAGLPGPNPGGDDGRGSWSGVISTPLVPVAGSVLPNGKVLLWSAYRPDTFVGSGTSSTVTAIFDPATSRSSSRTVSNTGHDMFCPGIANLADGRILVNGGTGNRDTSIYDPDTDSWLNAADMNIGRGYQGTTLLSDGRAFTLGGSWSGGLGGKSAEVWTDGQGWSSLPGIRPEPFQTNDRQGVYRADNHLWLFATSGGQVFHAGPSANLHWIDTDGRGSVTSAGVRGNDSNAMNGSAVMYEPGRILAVGGSPHYNDSWGTTNAHVIDITSGANRPVDVRQVESMSYRRTLHSSVLLPSGEVLVVGGQKVSKLFTDDDAVMVPELWDPASETFQEMAPMDVPRTYHSMAVLLPDGRVLVGGGGLCGDCGTNHQDVQIFTPPYLIDRDGSLAARPSITSAPERVSYGGAVEVRTSGTARSFSLVRVSSATHSVNNDQRRIPVDSLSLGDGRHRLQIPTDSGDAPPGSYMLFAFDGDGTPSVSRTVLLGGTSPTPAPTPTPGQIGGDNLVPTGPIVVPGLVQAEHYRPGSSGAAYSDTDARNWGQRDGQLNRNDEVDVYRNVATGEYIVGRTRNGEWTEYDIETDKDGLYRVSMRYASGLPTDRVGSATVTIDGRVVGTLDGESTGAWWDFVVRPVGTLELTRGTHRLRVTWGNGAEMNFDRLGMQRVSFN